MGCPTGRPKIAIARRPRAARHHPVFLLAGSQIEVSRVVPAVVNGIAIAKTTDPIRLTRSSGKE